MNFVPYLLVLMTGVFNAIHSGTNAKLNQVLARPWWAGVFVCVISGAVLLLGVAFARESFPAASGVQGDALVGMGWHGHCGHLDAVFRGPAGRGAFNGLVVTGTIVFSIVLDHYGLLGFDVHHASLPPIAGGALMLGGLALVCLF